MSVVIVSRKYARALYELAEEKDISKQVLQAFEEIKSILEKEQLMQYLATPLLEKESKKELCNRVLEQINLEKEVFVTLQNFMFLLIEKKRIDLITGICEEFRYIYHYHRNIQEMEVITPDGLSTEQKERMVAIMEEFTQKKILVEERQDQNLVGGIKIIIGTRVLDGSVPARLERIKENLQKPAG